MHTLRLSVLAAVLLTSGAAQAGEAYLTNDQFSSGSVNAGVFFDFGDRAGVLLEADPSMYPLNIIAVDVLAYSPSRNSLNAWELGIWSEAGGVAVDPPTTYRGNLYDSDPDAYQLIVDGTNFTRIPATGFSPPLVVNSGRVFVGLTDQWDSAGTGLDSDTTITLDNSPTVDGGNWYYKNPVSPNWTQINDPDAGYLYVANGNWIIRLVLQVPGAPDAGGAVTSSTSSTGSTGSTASSSSSSSSSSASSSSSSSSTGSSTGSTGVASTGSTASSTGATGTSGSGSAGTSSSSTSASSSGTGTTGSSTSSTSSSGSSGTTGAQLSLISISPAQMVNTEDTVVVLTGTGFQSDTQALIGPQLLVNPDIKSAAVIQGTVSKGTAPGTYDVVVLNAGGQRATLSKAFTVTQGSSAGTKAKGCGCGQTPVLDLAGLLLGALTLRRRRQSR